MPSKLSISIAVLIVLSCCRGHSQPLHGYEDDPRLTPLMNAAQHRDLSRVRELLSRGADVRAGTSQGQTTLYVAIERANLKENNLPLVRLLLSAGADSNETEIVGLSALRISLTRDYANPAVTKQLLRSGAIVAQSCPPQDSEESLVLLAAIAGHADLVNELISRGSPVNCVYRDMTALNIASLNGKYKIVKLLLKSGATPRQADLDTAETSCDNPHVRREYAKIRHRLFAELHPMKSSTR